MPWKDLKGHVQTNLAKKLITKFRKKCDACRGKVIKEEHTELRSAVPKDWASEKKI